MSDTWAEDAGGFTCGEATAERAADDNAFVITSFGPQPDAGRAFDAIKAARPFGLIRLRVTPQTKAMIEALTSDGRIKCVRAMGTEHHELGIIAMRVKP